MLKLSLSKKAQKFIKELPPKHQRQLKEKIEQLQKNPEPHDSQKLYGHPLRRTDVGEYRIIYHLEQGVLMIFLVGKRNDNDIYKRLKRTS